MSFVPVLGEEQALAVGVPVVSTPDRSMYQSAQATASRTAKSLSFSPASRASRTSLRSAMLRVAASKDQQSESNHGNDFARQSNPRWHTGIDDASQ